MQRIDPYIFRAYDIRGIYKKNLDEEIMLKIGYILGKTKQNFLVGRDIRGSGKKLANALINGLITSGSSVVYADSVSFGQALFAGWFLKKNKVLYVTASHLPSQWNGLKIYYGNGVSIPEKDIEKLKRDVFEIKDNEIKPKKNKIKRVDLKKEYSDYLLNKFSKIKNNKLKIVVDCGNGAMCLSAPQIFKKIGFNVSKLYCNIDQNFSGRGGEPGPKTIIDLKKMVKEKKADFGVAFDGDGDRAVIIDDKMRYLGGNEIGVLISKSILEKSTKKKIVATVSCSMALEKELKPFSAKIIRIPVGHSFVTLNCKKYNAVLGMEESGHMVITQYFWFDDAIIIPLKVAEIILEKKRKLSEIINDIQFYPFEEIIFNCSDENKFKILEKLKKDFLKKYKNVSIIDGVKINFVNSWVLIRVSNTSPIMRLYVEAIDKDSLKKLKQKFSKIIKDEIKKFKH